MESGQASLLSHAAEQVQENLSLDSYQNDTNEEIHDDDEIDLVKRILDLGSQRKCKVFHQAKSCSSSNTGSDHDATSENDSALVEDSANDHDPKQSALVEKVVDQTKNKIGRWDSKLVQTISKAIGVEILEISMENCTREVKTIQRLAESLRAQVDRCDESILMLKALAYGDVPGQVIDHRQEFLSDLVKVFGGLITSDDISPPMDQYEFEKSLKNVGINFSDSAGWLAHSHENDRNTRTIKSNGCCGNVASKYQDIRESDTPAHMKKMNDILAEQRDLVERMESFVYMNWLGTNIEKQFSKLRSESLAAWEKKTDITTAINIATKKRLPLLVNELKAKLVTLSSISHTSVKEAKERHLGSKALKAELEALSVTHLQKLKVSSTKGVMKAVLLWADYEQNAAAKEIQALSSAIQEIERSLRMNKELILADGGAHLFASSGVT